MKTKQILALLLAVLLVVAMFAGCSGKGTTNDNPSATKAPSGNTGTQTGDNGNDKEEDNSPYKFAAGKFETDEDGIALAPYDYELPISTTDEVLTYWNTCWTPQYIPDSGFSKMPYQASLEEMTGVHVEYLCPSAETRSENFAVMIAANDLRGGYIQW